MKYRLYVYGYECGWIRYRYKDIKDVQKTLNMLDPYEYGQYIIIKETDRDEIIDSGFIAKPHTNKLKPSKKH